MYREGMMTSKLGTYTRGQRQVPVLMGTGKGLYVQ
jgi:hypothetical protein